MNILLYLMILILGAIIGYKKLLREALLEKVADIQNYALLFLLFIMGVNIGIDEDVIKYFGIIGYQALILAICTIIFSVLTVKLIAKSILQQKEGAENDL